MEQQILNAVFGLVSLLVGWVLKTITDELKERRQADHALRNKVQTIEVVLAGKYVSKEDLNHMVNTLFVKLDKIESKLDGKQDKPHP